VVQYHTTEAPNHAATLPDVPSLLVTSTGRDRARMPATSRLAPASPPGRGCPACLLSANAHCQLLPASPWGAWC